jgi:hypothetical protein
VDEWYVAPQIEFHSAALLALFPQPAPSAVPWSVGLVLEQMKEVRTWLGRGDTPDDLIGALGMWIKTLSDLSPMHEQIAEVLDTWWEGTDPDGVMAEDVESLKASLFSLFPQPTPSIEPVRISDMAPGTAFTGDWTRYGSDDQFVRLNDGVRCVTPGRSYSGTAMSILSASLDIDPSTIRDVTPPSKETP